MSHDKSESLIMADWAPNFSREEAGEPSPHETAGTFNAAMEKAAAAHKDVFAAGVDQAHQKIKALREKYRDDFDGEAEEKRFNADSKKFGPHRAKVLAEERFEQEAIEHFEYPAPVWQQTTGLFPEWEKRMNPNERAGRIANLLRTVERMVRYEMKNEKGKIKKEQRLNGDREGMDDEPSVVRETYLWDPLRTVCFKLEISLAQLSRYSKETTGMSAVEMVDCIRMQSARKKMKQALRDFIAQMKNERGKRKKEQHDASANPQSEIRNPKFDLTAEEIWKELKSLRRAPRWHRTSWAAELGFSSYGKFFRASLLVCGVTPHELEMALLDEILADDVEAEVVLPGTRVSPPPVEADAAAEVEEVKRE